MSPERETPVTLSTAPQRIQGLLVAQKIPGAVWLAWSLCAVSLILIGISVLLAFLGRQTPLLEESAPWYGQAILALASAGAPVLGALIASRRLENLYGWLWLGVGLALAIRSYGGNYAEYAAFSGDLPAPVTAAAVGDAAWVVWVVLTPFLMLLFPDGRLPSPRWRFVAWTVIVAGAVSLVLGLFVPGQSSVASVDTPFGVEGRLGVVISALVIAGTFVIFGCTLLAALSLYFRYRRADGVQQQQIKWFAYSTVVVGGGLIFSGFLGRDLPGIWDAVFEGLAFSGLYVGVGIAILKHRLYDIDLIINRTLVYSALTACVVSIYVLIVGYLSTVFRTGGNLLFSLIATGVVAVLFAPLRERFQRGVNRLMYGERDDPYAVISRLGERLETAFAPDAVLPALVETVRETLKLPYAAIALNRGGASEISASAGEPVDSPLRLPLRYGNEPVGELLLGRRAGEEDFSAADRRLFGDLARQAGVAVHAVRLTADLQRSRERLVTAREEERRRLRRDLHDGLGAQLAGLNVQAGVLRRLIPHDPEAADGLVVELREELRAAIGDIRRLVYDLRPPALDDLGLSGALERLAERYGAEGDGLRVQVETPEQLPPLPAAVEVAVYRVAQETLTNVVRHAGARECIVRLATAEGWLKMEITDNGIGIAEEHDPGVGLLSMRERAAELGGSCEIESPAAGGTRLLVRLPLVEE
ncbi:hypothetical protein BH20ACT11_BH20ACT11_01650 [soil metagenome]